MMKKLLILLMLLPVFSEAQKIARRGGGGMDTVAHDGTLVGQGVPGNTLKVDTSLLVTVTDLDNARTIFTDSDFEVASTHFLLEDALGSWSTRFRSPSALNYFSILSDTTDTDFIGLGWNTVGGNAKIGHRLGGYYLEFGDDLIINSTNSFDRLFITYTIDQDDSNQYALATDPVTGRLEKVDFLSKAISGVDQYLTSDRLLTGGDTYDLLFDSLPRFDMHADEFFLTDEATTVIDWASTTDRYLKQNAGLLRLNSLGLDYAALQNTDGVDQLNFVWATEAEVRIGSLQKEELSVASFGPVLIMDPLAGEWTYGSAAGIRIDGDAIEISGSDSLVIDMSGITVDASIDTLLAIAPSGRIYKKPAGSTSGGVAYDDYASGSVTSTAVRLGGGSSTITNPAAGQYSFVVNSSGYIQSIDLQGNSANLDGSNQLTLTIDNSTNARDRLFNIQMIDLNSNSQVNAFVTGTNYTQSASGNITTIVLSNMNGFGAAGYKIMLR